MCLPFTIKHVTNFFTENLKLVAKIKFQDKERDGVIYHEAKELKIEHEYGDKVIFSLTNLFQGNPELSK